MTHTKCLIIGSGPAGYTAAIYAGRANLQPVEYCGLQQGGQLTQTTEVENFPGYPNGVDGTQLMMDIRQQALRFGADIRDGEIVRIDLSERPFRATADSGEEILADTLIIATGASARYLGIEGEAENRGMGVSACATCDGFFYRKKTVAVVGGGDTACEDALYLAGLARKVYLVVRKPFLRASKVMQQRVIDNPNIEILFEHRPVKVLSDRDASGQTLGVSGVQLVKRQGEADETVVDLAVDGIFLAIGHTPNTGLFQPFLPTDDAGYLLREGATPRTVIPGCFVAGDCADPVYRQAITAAASGCQAAIEAERFLLNN